MDRQAIADCIPHLRRYARALVGGRDTADDLVQDTLERALRKFALWRPGNLRAWLFSIMHNVYMNQLRERRISPSLEVDATIAGTASAASGAEVRDLERGLATLSAEQREVLLLVSLEDMSYDEVARTLGIPAGTVMSRLSRGRERLRAFLDGETARPALKVVR